MKIVAFANQKGGVGKTTTAVNLAACLAEKGVKILLLDFDPQSNATSAIGVGRREGHSAYPALLGEGLLKDEIVNTAVPNLNLIPSELNLAGAEVDIARSENYLHCLKNVLQDLPSAADYDFIFIDCPPSLGILTSNALMAADEVIIPVQCEYLPLEGLSMITDLIRKLAEVGNAVVKLEGIIMTMFDSRTNLSGEVVEEVKKHFAELVYATVIPRSVRLSEAPSYGQPIIVYDNHSSGAAAYRALADEFLGRHCQPPPAPTEVIDANITPKE
jgi:chromosome partitioning protein